MMQPQSSRIRKNPISNNFPPQTTKLRDKDIGKFGKMDPTLNYFPFPLSVSSGEMGLSQDDDMVPWFNYPIDDTLEQDYCSELLSEVSSVTVKEPSIQNSFASIHRSNCNNKNNGMRSEQGNASKVSSSRNDQLYPWSLQQGQTSAPSLRSGASDIIGNNTNNTDHAVCGISTVDFPCMKMQKQDLGFPCSNSSLLNFSHFSRPAAFVRANLQNIGSMATMGSSIVERMEIKDKGCASNPAECALIDSSIVLQKETGSHSQPNLVSTKVDSKPSLAKPLWESCTDAIENDKAYCQVLGTNTKKGVPDGEKIVEPTIASSVCSGNSAERASHDLTNNLKRKCCDAEESECQSEDVEEESVKRAGPARGGTGSKRSRAAEVHNLSERKRRDRINEKMRALQELIPNCNKVDKASMLDEAIEYLKTLQLQVQIMSMGAGMYMPPFMLPAGMQHIHAAHMPHFSPMGFGMGMGFGMRMLDMNGGSPGRAMVPLAPMQGSHFPSQPGPNFQVLGHPTPGFPLSVQQAPLAHLSGRPPMNSDMELNASRMGVHLQVPSTDPTFNSKDLKQNTNSQAMHNADASVSLNQKSSQVVIDTQN